MLKLIWDDGFKKKLKKIKNILYLFTKEPFATKLKNHKLSGKMKNLRAIIIEYYCRIIFSFTKKDEALLISIGTHDEVY